jgi:uncharacterized protein YceH (UPF0502 family)
VDLTPVEVRVLGCLVEKELTTPQAYPLTLNSLRLACNQSTNRDPVVDYGDGVVEAALGTLREGGLTRIVYSRTNRAAKYRHVLDEAWGLDVPQRAVLAVLGLRGPQTLGELKVRTERMHPFADLGEVEAVLERLAAAEPEPLAVRLERRPGQKDARYLALLGPLGPPPPSEPAPPPGGEAGPEAAPPAPAGVQPATGGLATEVARLRADLEGVRAELGELRADLDAFRAQFS